MRRLLSSGSLVFAFLLCSCGSGNVSGPLQQDVYVWQRTWAQGLAESIEAHSAAFNTLTVLGTEISFQKNQPQVVRARIDFAALRTAKCRIGIALRVGPYRGPFAAEDETAALIQNTVKSLLRDCDAEQIPLAELQIDFDCATSKLEGYARWLRGIRPLVGKVPLVITALPTWLRETHFRDVLAESDEFVLQVHSLDRPKSLEAPFTLCDPNAARAAVRRAAKLGKPFRVALPTYGYEIAFDRQKKFLGLSAEGPAKNWPEGTLTRQTRADPVSLAGLVSQWSAQHPRLMRGLIWYRLPVPSDSLNWSWPTLAAVMQGRTPRESVRAEILRPRPGLVEIILENDGEASAERLPAVAVGWENARLIAADGLGDFSLESRAAGSVQLTTRRSRELKPGERRKVGWLRLEPGDQPISVRTF